MEPQPGELNPQRSRPWQWWIGGLLLLATMINYMDRQTLANLSVRITDELSLSQEQYGDLELSFGLAFATGSLIFGVLADRLPVRWLYPMILLCWSAVGIATGLVSSYSSMLICRTMLGFFEAGHWPCALRTTQAVFERRDRTFANSILQSGGALGAIITPLVISAMVGKNAPVGAWRSPFVIIGLLGTVWIAGWLCSIRSNDLVPRNDGDVKISSDPTPVSASGLAVWMEACFLNRRFWTLIPFVISLNATWHLLRVWIPKFLQQGRGVSESEALYFNSLYFVAADIGTIGAGAASLWLVKRGMQAQRARLAIVAGCSLFCALTIAAAMMPRGPLLSATLLVIGAAAAGLFPCYYSYAQEVCPRHMGKATGMLAAIGWFLSSPMQKAFGRLVDSTGSFDLGFALFGLPPLLSLLVLILAYRRND
jgi:ACS family hexuronate transporter-like MFS transporter